MAGAGRIGLKRVSFRPDDSGTCNGGMVIGRLPASRMAARQTCLPSIRGTSFRACSALTAWTVRRYSTAPAADGAAMSAPGNVRAGCQRRPTWQRLMA